MKLIDAAYLASHFFSTIGNGVAAVALPLVVLKTTGNPLSMGLVSLTTAIPAVVVGLFAGVLIDRWNRRNFSIASDVISAVSVAALPLVDAIWGLNLAWFIVLGIIGAVGDVPGQTAREVLLAAVARRSSTPLERLVGLRQVLTSIALVVGPAIAGTLIAFLGTTAVFLVIAATSAAAALLTTIIPRTAGQVPRDNSERGSSWQEVSGGLRVLRRSRFLMSTVVLTIGLTVAGGGLQGLVLPLHFTALARPELLGFVLTAMSIGMLAGGIVFATLGKRGSRRAWLTSMLLTLTAGLLTLSTLGSLPLIFAGSAVIGVSSAVLVSVLGVLQVEHTPDHARGRVLAVQNSAVQLAAPIGIGGAGLVAGIASPTAAAFALTAVWILAVIIVLASRALHTVNHAPVTADA